MIAILINRLRSNKLFKNIFNLSILQVISALLSLVLIPLLARILEPTIFGLIMFIHLITSYFIWFSEWGFSQGGTQKIASVRSNFSELSSSLYVPGLQISHDVDPSKCWELPGTE